MNSILAIVLTFVHTLEAADCGVCISERGVCCKNFVLRDGKCTKCPAGTFDNNCTVKCPEGYYGNLCAGKCNCSRYETWHPLKGCIDEPKHYKAKYDNCKAGKENKTINGCCVNQRKEGEKCTDCWTGYFGENCEKNCLQDQERFGRFCLEQCSCHQNETCDIRHGCQAGKITTSRSKDFINWEIVLGIGVTFTAIIGIIGINVIKRMLLSRQPRKQSDLNQTKVNDVYHFNTDKEYVISSETRPGVPKVKISGYSTLQREPETGIQTELEAYSTFSDFKTCSKV